MQAWRETDSIFVAVTGYSAAALQVDLTCVVGQAWHTTDTVYTAVQDYEMTLSHRVEKEGGFVTERAARIVCAEVVLALEFVHALDIVHRDVSAENLLVDREGHVRLSGWGLCCPDVSVQRLTNDLVGTPDYQVKVAISYSCVWSSGVFAPTCVGMQP